MKKWLVSLLSIIAVVAVNADPVSRSEALQKARQFMPGKQFNADQAFARGKKVMAESEPFYIFNAEEGGFVVISGDDRTVPVIGYSEKGELLQDNMPDNLRSWLDGYAEQLKAIENGEATPALPRSTRVTRGVGAKSAINPLIQTRWDQFAPYNLTAPVYTYTYNNKEYTEQCVTGCAATALAQVMNFFRWPTSSCPALDAYSTTSLGLNVGALPATTFKWNLMKNTYANEETGDEANEVAKLMRYIGQSIFMDYNIAENGGSAASIYLDVLINTFGYSRNMHTVSRDAYTTAEWENLIYQELAANRPVLYNGETNTGGGHYFICDGYDGSGLFHINWGWGGTYDTYFVISLANPYETDNGGGTGESGFIFRQVAFVGLQPASTPEPEIPAICSDVSNFSNTTYSRASGDKDFENVSTSGCIFYGTYSYVPTTTYSIEVGWGLWQDDALLSVLTTTNSAIDNRTLGAGGYFHLQGPTSVSFGKNLPDGDYRLVQVWRPQGGGGDWTVMSSTNSLRVTIAGNDLTIRKPNTYPVTYTVNTVDFGTKLVTGQPTKIMVNLTNTCDANQLPLYFWVYSGSSWSLLGKGLGFVESGETGDAEILYVPKAAGEYSACITLDGNTADPLWQGTITIYGIVQKEVGGIIYRFVEGDDCADIVDSNSSLLANTAVTIPGTVVIDNNSYRVRKIGSYAFLQRQMTSLTIEPGVEEIGAMAFWNCQIGGNIIIPEGVKTIGAQAFEYCYRYYVGDLSQLSLPYSLISIGENAFGGFTSESLENINCDMRKPCDISASVFQGQNNAFTSATLTIPIGTRNQYEAAQGWQQFFNNAEGVGETPGRRDANGDGSISVTDISAIVDNILSIVNGGGFSAHGADANGDGKVTVTDIGIIVDTILGNSANSRKTQDVEPQ